MPRLPTKLRILLVALLGSCGCYTTGSRDPFREPDPNVRVAGLPRAAAGAVSQVGLGMRDVVARVSGGTPRYLEWARTFNDPASTPDDLRQAMMGLVRYEHGRKPPYTDAYAEAARRSPDALVRATAIRALNISRDARATPLFVEKLEDESDLVRLEAAKALANVPADAAPGPLLEVARSPREVLDVRLAAVDALGRYDNPQLRQALIAMLEADDFSLAWQARQSLVNITGEDHGFNLDAWRQSVG